MSKNVSDFQADVQHDVSTQQGDIYQSGGDLTITKSFSFFSGNWVSIILVGILSLGGAAALLNVTIRVNSDGITIRIENEQKDTP
ncbi:MAG: hypothetical protein QNJ51_17675 [Calothrix sp. MO_167.B12]|nr:hypothetical protein [Calothrix sp. MO_167.B12]